MKISSLYVDATEEITAVIERLKAAHEPIIALIVPKGATLTQSIVNLKLARKAAADAEKDLILVTTDPIGRNLATQLGIPVAANEKDVPKVAAGEIESSDPEAPIVAGVRIHRYYTEEDTSIPAELPTDVDPEMIVPRGLTEELTQPLTEPIEPTPELMKTPEITPASIEVIPPAPSLPVVSKPIPPIVAPPITRSGFGSSELEPMLEPKTEAKTAKMPSKDNSGTKKPKRWIPLAVVVSALLISGIAISFLFYPIINITLTVQAESWQKSLELQASSGASSDATAGTLAAQDLKEEVEASETFQGTGKQQIGEQAKGDATIFNSQESSAQSLAAGARILANGRYFTTDSDITVPGVTVKSGQLIPGSAPVKVTAEAPGSESNLTAIAANIVTPANSKLYAQISSTSGGSSQEVTIVTASDITKARNALIDITQQQLTDKLNSQASEQNLGYADNNDRYSVTNFTTTIAAGEQADSFVAALTGKLERLAITKSAAEDLARVSFGTDIPSNQELVVDSIQVQTVTASTNGLTVLVNGLGKLTPLFSTKLLPDALKGKSFATARQLLEDSTPASQIDLDEKPSWWPVKRIPTFPTFLKINTVYE